MRDLEARAQAIVRARATAVSPVTSPVRAKRTVGSRSSVRAALSGVPESVLTKLRKIVRRVPRAQRAEFARRLLVTWQARRDGSVAMATNMPTQQEARDGLALVVALDEAGAFDG